MSDKKAATFHGGEVPEPLHPAYSQPVKKKKRLFMWFFLAVNVIFLIMFISGLSTAGDNDCASQVTEYFTQADCEAASGVGTALGAGMLVAFWLAVDFILVLIWAVVKLARR